MKENKKTVGFSMLGTKFINPEEIIDRLGFKNGMKIADFGCGTGYFVFPIAKRVSPHGTIWALDILKQKIEIIESQAKLSGITNIIAKRANLEKEKGSSLPKESIDWVIMVNMLFQNDDKNSILTEAKRVLKKSGKILLVEWNEKNLLIGPDKKLKISKDKLINILEKNNLMISDEIEVSNFHYGLILKKQK